ncbi:hypothetical protein BLA29_004939 [Euroglyphus maynei]|uniref:Dolichyl-diphosphooligosaccharide--protein glycosyltransferase subunit 1 n=1 Tax=Euroglyphus maynei TaxID=6958 RepID=A0A1Y3B7V0_EURMA|nr:hypothetical protein BLA29_004939 [Euroglyphus maynei]
MFSSIKFLTISILLSISCSFVISASNDNIINAKVERTIDISSQLVTITSQVVVLNKGSQAAKEYLIQFGDSRHDENLSYLSVSRVDSSAKKKDILKVSKNSNSGASVASYKIDLGEFAIPSGSSIQLEIEATFTHLLDPYPIEINQADRQLVVYNGRIYFPTPYMTETQTTRVRLPSSTGAESYTKLRPVTYSDRFINYGPYDKIPPTNDAAESGNEELRVHVENNTPFLTVESLSRTIQISHWAGAISVEETLDVVHTGAKLKGPFSRYEYQREPVSNGVSSIRSWKTRLPAGAHDIYYRDEIGNISTSNVRMSSSSVYVDIKPRFPLFGGWKTKYILGYTLPAKNNLFALNTNTLTNGDYILRMPFIDHIYDNMVIDQATVRIILPEGANDFRVTHPYDVKREPDELFYSYLDTIGRPVIVLSKKNLVEWHIQPFELRYNYKPFYLLQEPLLIVGSIFGLCILVMALVRTKISLDDK